MKQSSGIQKYLHSVYSFAYVCLSVFAMVFTAHSFAQATNEINTQNTVAIDQEAIQKFTDGFFKAQVNNKRIPGAFIAMVKGDNVIMQSAYGLADIANKTKMDSHNGIYRVASISKAYTNIAIIKLINDGILKLDDDIQQYLPEIEIYKTFSEPITIADLLSHVEGYEEYYIETIVKDGNPIPSLKDYLQRNQPARVYKPGQELTYGSHGVALLGRIAENVTGKSFEDFIADSFFAPLGMTNSSFVQPIPSSQREKLVKEYNKDKNGFKEVKLVYPVIPPPGSGYSSGDDIVSFLKFINSGGADYLSKESFKLITEQAYSPNKNLAGITHAFFEQELNGLKTITRNGDGTAFRSTIFHIPKYNLSFMFIYNVDDNKLRNEYVKQLMNRFFPYNYDANAKHALSSYRPDYKSLIGTYKPIQSAKNGIVKLQILFAGKIKVLQSENESLIIDPGENGDIYGGFEEKMEFIHIGNNTFVGQDGNNKIVFYKKNGKLFLASGFGYHGVFEKTSFWENPYLHVLLAIVWAVAMLLAFLLIIFWLIKKILALANGKRGAKVIHYSGFLWGFIAVQVLSAVYTLGVNYHLLLGDGSSFEFGIPYYFLRVSPAINFFLKLPYLIIVVILAVMAYQLVRLNKAKQLSVKSFLPLTTFILLEGVFLWQHWYWNLW